MSARSEKIELVRRIHPQKFALWAAMASMVMFFGAFTSAYIVKQAAGSWLEFPIPNLFYISTVVLLVSSVTLHMSYKSYVKSYFQNYRNLLLVSLILGILFVILQYFGWMELFNMGVDMKVNVSGSFFYLITGAHAAHILGGIAAIVVAVIHSRILPLEFKESRRHRFELVLQYWHFVDVLWIYLLIFLLTVK